MNVDTGGFTLNTHGTSLSPQPHLLCCQNSDDLFLSLFIRYKHVTV